MFEYVDSAEPLRQGDILKRCNPVTAAPDRTLIIVTPDCDLVWNKTFGRITAVPILEIDEYIQFVRIPSEAAKLLDRALLDIRDSITLASRRLRATAVGPDIFQIRDWLIEEGPEQMADSLELKAGDREKFIEIAATCHRIIEASNASCHKTIDLNEYAQLTRIVSTGNKAKRPQSILKEWLTNLPDDVFELSTLHGSDTLGRLAFLRHPLTLTPESIGQATDMNRHNTAYVRTARLCAPYKHAISVRFGTLFTRVGVPEENRQLYRLAVEEHCEKYGEK